MRYFDKSMNTTLSRLRSVITLVALATAFSVSTAHAETKVTASIQPKGKIAKVDLPALAKISFADACKAAETAGKGSAIKGELEVEDGNLMYFFDVVTADKKVLEVEIDAGDGKVLDIDTD